MILQAQRGWIVQYLESKSLVFLSIKVVIKSPCAISVPKKITITKFEKL